MVKYRYGGVFIYLDFIKMHGCGNDYIYFGGFRGRVADPHTMDLFGLCDRHKGIGGDGIVLVLPSVVAHGRMQMFNIDGSEGAMCGNAIRCVAKLLFDEQIAPADMEIETASGVKKITVYHENGVAHSAQVDMGQAVLGGDCSCEGYKLTRVSMGNPHAVAFLDEIDNLDLETIGPPIENNPIFPDRVNTEFVQVIARNHLKMRVWERGSGETMACGTGACAAAVAAVLNGFCDMDTDITVDLRGGSLIIKYTKDTVLMTGDCVKVFEGKVEI
ncbi:MAG: diaminopimelate epimerase [Defluviitaleaceae bacterium]|nr:diaminopimelate epimerase [Defluviitaleaceae bacterium]